ncbi:MAG: hypothetical protein RLY93_14605 [Sumerlaeia bacterium]
MPNTSNTTGFLLSRNWLMPRLRKAAPSESDVLAFLRKVREDVPADASRDQLAQAMARALSRKYAKQGAMMALPGSIPGIGTLMQIGVEVATIGVDLQMMLRHQALLCFAMAHVWGLDVKDREARLEDTMSSIALWTGALKHTGQTSLARTATRTVAKQLRAAPKTVVQRVNRKIATKLMASYAGKRVGKTAGRMVPFGVGMALGAGLNLRTMEGFAKVAEDFYQHRDHRLAEVREALRSDEAEERMAEAAERHGLVEPAAG